MATILWLGELFAVFVFQVTPLNMIALVFGGVVATEVVSGLVRAVMKAMEGGSGAVCLAAPMAVRWGIVAVAAVKFSTAVQGIHRVLAVLDSLQLPP